MYSDQLTIINPKTFSIIGSITVPKNTAIAGATGSTEEMVIHEGYLYVNCWSYEKNIVKIDTATDKVVGTLEVGIQPYSLVKDRNGKLWTLCDGGYEGSPIGYEAPVLCRIDPTTMSVEARYSFSKGDYISKVRINGTGDIIPAGAVIQMDADRNFDILGGIERCIDPVAEGVPLDIFGDRRQHDGRIFFLSDFHGGTHHRAVGDVKHRNCVMPFGGIRHHFLKTYDRHGLKLLILREKISHFLKAKHNRILVLLSFKQQIFPQCPI
jgi:hypothetical protein